MAKKKKSSARKSVKRPATKRKKAAASKPDRGRRPTGSTSVDALLKRFAKDRTAKEAQLGLLQKNREELEKRAAKLKAQITKLMDQENKSETELAQLDSLRDQQVKQLLAKLGVQLRDADDSAGNQQPPSSSALDGKRDNAKQEFAHRRHGRN